MMNLEEIIKRHGKGKGEQAMWKAVSIISDFIEKHEEDIDDTDKLYHSVYGILCGEHFDKEFAEEAIEEMFYQGKDGSIKHAPYWAEQTMGEVYNSISHLIPSCYTEHDFWVVLNMLKSDYGSLLESWFQNDAEQKIVEMSVAYLNDPDAKHKDSKIWCYLMQ